MLYRVHDSGLTATSARFGNRHYPTKLREANIELLLSAQSPESTGRRVLNQRVNLERHNHSDALGFMLALPFMSIGGAEKLFTTLAESIVERGYRLIIITSLTLPAVVPEETAGFERVTPYIYHLAKLFSNDDEREEFLSYLIRRYNVRTLLLAGCEFAYDLLPELVLEFPELTVIDQLFNNSVHVANNRRYTNYIAGTVVPSEPLFRFLIDELGAHPETVHLVPHGIHMPDLELTTSGSSAALPKAAEGKIVIAFFGRLSNEKAPDTFVKITHRLRRESSLFFVMTGEGPERDKILKQISNLGVRSKIYSPGFVPNVEPLMRAADIVVLPSRLDGMPLAVLEAQALGKPVVSSRVGSLPEMIVDHETGFLCEASDIQAFCTAILLLARDPELRKRMGAAGRRRMVERFGSERMLEHYHQIFTKLNASSRLRGLAATE
jgi:glycosyltransferase involved in cell wall biosynthesis